MFSLRRRRVFSAASGRGAATGLRCDCSCDAKRTAMITLAGVHARSAAVVVAAGAAKERKKYGVKN